jgi:beta-N-acetylhexosaminidase
VADVPRPGAALERERRAYARPGTHVARQAVAFARALERGGVRSTAKHFPGFGAAGVNTDFSPARIPTPLRTLREVDARPFGALVRAGVDAVMLSTAVYPALDERPAAFSRRWVTGELRGRLRFRGMTITDDLGTPAVARYTIGGRARLAIRAGVDVPLFAGGYAIGARAAEQAVKAARAGRISRAALEEGARRVLRLRARAAR